jgi:hypothetical protein
VTRPDPRPDDLADDDTLVALLGEALDQTRPLPAAARAAALAAFDLGHLEGELARVVADSALDEPLVGARHDSAADRYVEIEAEHVRIEVELPAGQDLLIGQVDPPDVGVVTVELATASGGVERFDVEVDGLGRFRTALGAGTMRLHLTTPEGPVATPWVVR